MCGAKEGRRTEFSEKKTEQNIRNFQKTKGLPADGIVGKKTWSALLQSREK
ncbi:MAG: peptidoglycan-binding domain-containing protein [Lachnospiraceae bacterium]